MRSRRARAVSRSVDARALVLALTLMSCGGAVRQSSATITYGSRTRESASEPRSAPVSETRTEPTPRTTEDTRPAIDVIEGRVSYYADSLAGRSTASGEPYDPRELTAASRELPFGTIIRVVRVDTGASVVVRVNDRGPFGRRTRILDLSRAAAEALDMIRAGVVEVRAEILERGPSRR